MLLIIVWDMNKVQELSTVIHNDHASMWIAMNDSIISATYSAFAMCIINTTVSPTTGDIRTNCAHHHRKDRISLPFCAVGYALGKECTGSLLSESNYYLKTLRQPEFASAADGLPDMLFKLAQARWSLVFVGDKVSMQHMNALLCAIEDRADSSHTVITYNGPGNHTVSWRKSRNISLEINFVSLRGILSAKEKNNYRFSQSSQLDLSYNISGSNLLSVQVQVERAMSRSSGIVLIANAGSFYNTRVSYREEIPKLLKWMNTIGEHNIVFFRESTSQHWNTTRNGYYFIQQGASSAREVSCQPNIDSSPALDWRNGDAKAVATSSNLKEIHWLSFHDITAPLYNMHPFGDKKGNVDCTQYCYFPTMWHPLWRQMIDLIMISPKVDVESDVSKHSHS